MKIMDIQNINNEEDLNVVIGNLRNKFKIIDAYRDPIITKMMNTIDKMEIDFEEDRPSMIEAKLDLLTKFDDYLKSKENNALNSVKVAMQKRVDDASVNYQEQTVALLRNIAPSAVINSANTFQSEEAPSDEDIEKRIGETKNLTPITEDEMDMSETGQNTAFSKNA